MLRSDSNQAAEDRRQMVRNQLESRGIQDERILQAMRDVPREEFVGELRRPSAFSDGALPIDCGQTISQPFTVAFMCEAARVTASDKVLEIGTGSGYGAAVLSRLCREVVTVERIPTLSKLAAERLSRLGYSNVHVHTANGTLGKPEQAPFDAIVVTAGAETLPTPYVSQLCDGGRIVIPLGGPHGQTMHRFTSKREALQKEELGSFAFVPLVGEFGWPE